MIRGSIPWVVRAARDWAVDVVHGMGLISYETRYSRDSALAELRKALEASSRSVGVIECAELAPEAFVKAVAASTDDVLLVLDPHILLFGDKEQKNHAWVNFQRETLVRYAGVQLWWFTKGGLLRFSRELPDLNRFFLFREELRDESDLETPAFLRKTTEFAERSVGLAELKGPQSTLVMASSEETLAEAWLNEAKYYHRQGRYEEALREGGKAMEAFRSLATKNPEAFLPRLAMCLTDMAVIQGEAGQLTSSLSTTGEITAIYRVLAQSKPGEFRPMLARSLSVLAIRQMSLEQRSAALESIREAVVLFRELSQVDPHGFLAGLGDSLNIASTIERSLGLAKESLASIGESVAILNGIAATQQEVLPDLASAFHNMANRLATLGQAESALTAIGEAVAIRRQLLASESPLVSRDLAVSLIYQAEIQRSMGRLREALASADEAVRTYRSIAEPNGNLFLADLALSMEIRAGILLAVGQPGEAKESIGEAVEIFRTLAAKTPQAFLPGLASVLDREAVLQSRMSDVQAAVLTSAEAVEIFRGLAAKEPDAFDGMLAGALTNLANLQTEAGRRREAQATVEEAVGVRRRLFAVQPGAYRSDLVLSLGVWGQVLLRGGDPASALGKFEEGLRLLGPTPQEGDARLARALATDLQAASAASKQELSPEVAGMVQGILRGYPNR